MTSGLVTRRAGLADLDALLDIVVSSTGSYVEFAPDGWQPFDFRARRDWEAEVLADPATWALLGFVDAAPVGLVSFTEARQRRSEDPDGPWQKRPVIPELAHLRQLFVLPDWWGRGVALRLHDAAISEMLRRRYPSARLYTPAGHARARRFYERRGWKTVGEAWNDELCLPLVEYRLALKGYAPGSQPGR
jgi:GNAT superfamily N-acetyltransferase